MSSFQQTDMRETHQAQESRHRFLVHVLVQESMVRKDRSMVQMKMWMVQRRASNDGYGSSIGLRICDAAGSVDVFWKHFQRIIFMNVCFPKGIWRSVIEEVRIYLCQ